MFLTAHSKTKTAYKITELKKKEDVMSINYN